MYSVIIRGVNTKMKCTNCGEEADTNKRWRRKTSYVLLCKKCDREIAKEEKRSKIRNFLNSVLGRMWLGASLSIFLGYFLIQFRIEELKIFAFIVRLIFAIGVSCGVGLIAIVIQGICFAGNTAILNLDIDYVREIKRLEQIIEEQNEKVRNLESSKEDNYKNDKSK